MPITAGFRSFGMAKGFWIQICHPEHPANRLRTMWGMGGSHIPSGDGTQGRRLHSVSFLKYPIKGPNLSCSPMSVPLRNTGSRSPGLSGAKPPPRQVSSRPEGKRVPEPLDRQREQQGLPQMSHGLRRDPHPRHNGSLLISWKLSGAECLPSFSIDFYLLLHFFCDERFDKTK